jgi:hypothetical protein
MKTALMVAFFSIKRLVISMFRNHEVLKCPYGYWTKQRFQLCGQLFEGQKVYLLWFV